MIFFSFRQAWVRSLSSGELSDTSALRDGKGPPVAYVGGPPRSSHVPKETAVAWQQSHCRPPPVAVKRGGSLRVVRARLRSPGSAGQEAVGADFVRTRSRPVRPARRRGSAPVTLWTTDPLAADRFLGVVDSHLRFADLPSALP